MPIDNRRARELAAESLPQKASPLAVGHWEAVIMRACAEHAAPALEALREIVNLSPSGRLCQEDAEATVVSLLRIASRALAEYEPRAGLET